MKKTIAIIATLDTKEEEVRYLKAKFNAKGLDVLLIDTSTLRDPTDIKADVSSKTIAKAAGTSIEKIRKKFRSPAVLDMAKGVSKIVKDLYDHKRFNGILSISGETGAHLASAGMKVLPIGVPKLMVSCIFQGNSTFGSYVDTNDIMMMHSIIDILGVNTFSKKIFDNAVAAMTGMINEGVNPRINADRLIAVTMNGNTTPTVMNIREIIKKKGYDIVAFHPNGTGGRAMEEYITKGVFRAVLDMTTQDITDQVLGGDHPGGIHRLEAAGKKGIPQIFIPGCMDFIVLTPEKAKKYKNRKSYPHNPSATLIRTTKEEMKRLAKVVAVKLNKSIGRTIVVFPLQGISMYNKEGYPMYDAEADRAFIDTLKQRLNSSIDVFEIDAHINDIRFSKEVSLLLLKMLEDD